MQEENLCRCHITEMFTEVRGRMSIPRPALLAVVVTLLAAPNELCNS